MYPEILLDRHLDAQEEGRKHWQLYSPDMSDPDPFVAFDGISRETLILEIIRLRDEVADLRSGLYVIKPPLPLLPKKDTKAA